MMVLTKYCCNHSLCVCVCGGGKEEGKRLLFPYLNDSWKTLKINKPKREKRECHCNLFPWEKVYLGCAVGPPWPCFYWELSNCPQWAVAHRTVQTMGLIGSLWKNLSINHPVIETGRNTAWQISTTVQKQGMGAWQATAQTWSDLCVSQAGLCQCTGAVTSCVCVFVCPCGCDTSCLIHFMVDEWWWAVPCYSVLRPLNDRL